MGGGRGILLFSTLRTIFYMVGTGWQVLVCIWLDFRWANIKMTKFLSGKEEILDPTEKYDISEMLDFLY